MLKVIEKYNYTLRYSKCILKDLRNIVYNDVKQNEYISIILQKCFKVIEKYNYTLRYSKYILKDLRNIVYNGIKQNEYEL